MQTISVSARPRTSPIVPVAVVRPIVAKKLAALKVGDRVWFRHAKAGELCERFDVVHLIAGGSIVDTVPTYRGEGQTFL